MYKAFISLMWRSASQYMAGARPPKIHIKSELDQATWLYLAGGQSLSSANEAVVLYSLSWPMLSSHKHCSWQGKHGDR